MNCFSKIMTEMPEYLSASSDITQNRLPIGILGLSHIHKAHLVMSLCDNLNRNALVIVPDESTAAKLSNDINSFGGVSYHYPARDFNFYSTESRSREYEQLRLGVLDKMLGGSFGTVVCSVEAAMQFTIPPGELSSRSILLKKDMDIPVESIVSMLVKAGFTRTEQVEGSGQFSVRGGILDLFSPNEKHPCRIEFWGDTLDTLSYFDVESQRRINNIDELKIIPANEIVVDNTDDLADIIEQHAKGLRGSGSPKAKQELIKDAEHLRNGLKLSSADKYLSLIYKKQATIFDYAVSSMLFISETFTVAERAEACDKLINEEIKTMFLQGLLCRGLDTFTLSKRQLIDLYLELGAIYLDNLPRGSFDTPVKDLITINARQSSTWNGSLSTLTDDLKPVAAKKDYRAIVFAGTEKAARNLSLDLEEEGLKSMFFGRMPDEIPLNTVTVLMGTISASFDYPSSKVTAVSYGNRVVSVARTAKKVNAKNMFSSLDELHKGDYIVHNLHGIGVFDGITAMEAGGTVKDYIIIRYDKGDTLYTPVTQLDQVSRYIGGKSDDGLVKLNKLGGKEWKNTRAKVRKAIKEMAKELIELYAKRMSIKGFAFLPDIDMQNDFERRFEFEETSDQLRCISEIKNDMEKAYPMDRLLCGDVGFGKTEVAFRAAFKCIADGKQCAILVPTTILALQHYQTINRRFEGFPIEAAMLSRFCTAKEITKTLKNIKRGSVDIVVGTHRLISKDIEFKDLGLIIIDEEQRFGVAQKEHLKELFPSVDVLTLTATPIPRTLNMAMSGIRDMSVLEIAPQDRHPVQTYVLEHDMEVLAQAMQGELRRGGQVYYLHNRVESIEKTAAKIKNFLPDAKISIAHGKMDEDELSEVWRSLIDNEIDILVCTTIIETGVDVPNVNTLIIEDADRMGLAQLHQIRGRVGRSARRASAYFTYTRGKQLTEIADRRLSAIREYTEFGSGFKIAMRDLEIRGAGNVLGSQQHGHIEAVGYEMYVKLLSEAISEEKGENDVLSDEKGCVIDLPIDAYFPNDYISNVPHRLSMYRRIADIADKADAEDVIDELIDRFGEPPESVMGLITVSLLRVTAKKQSIYEITRSGSRLLLYIDILDMNKISRLAQIFKGRITVSNSGNRPHIVVKLLDTDDQLKTLTTVLDIMAAELPKAINN